MITCSFLWTKATYALKDGLDVQFETSEITEEIEIAAKWEKVGDGGHIGEGFTKRGIYVRSSSQCQFDSYLTNPLLEGKIHGQRICLNPAKRWSHGKKRCQEHLASRVCPSVHR